MSKAAKASKRETNQKAEQEALEHIKKPRKIDNVFRIFWRSVSIPIKQQWIAFVVLLVSYAIFDIFFVKGLGSSNVSQLKNIFTNIFHGSTASIKTNLSIFGVLIGNSASTSNATQSTYQTILFLVFSLMIIWALRQTMLNKGVRIKIGDIFYKSLGPVIPFLLVLCLLFIEAAPIAISSYLYSVVFGTGIAAATIDKVIWIAICALLVLVSIYLLLSTIFAFYIVTLPDMRPMQAVRSSWRLVKKRRLVILRKILFLPVSLIILIAIISLPFIVIFAPSAQWVIFILGLISIMVVHSYMYTLYRELL